MPSDNVADRPDKLQDKLLALGERVTGMLGRSIELLQRPDVEGQEWLVEEGRQARQLRLQIEMRCLAFIASRRTAERGGRSLAILVEIASDLELVGEHARQIGRTDYAELDGCLGQALTSIHSAAGVVGSMVRQAVWAAVQGDEAAAQGALARAKELAPLIDTSQQQARGVMQRRPRCAGQAIHLAHSVNQLRLAAEKAISICSWVLFDLKGGNHGSSDV